MKQFFFPLTEPLGVIWLFMALSVLWLLVQRQWRAGTWLGIPTLLVFLLGSTSLADRLVAAEEAAWARERVTQSRPNKAEKEDVGDSERRPAADTNGLADAVLVLGGGAQFSAYDPLGFSISDGGSRILTGISLMRCGRAKTLVLGGGFPLPGSESVSSMTVVQGWVEHWSLVNGPLTNLGICYTTHDEAVAFQKLKESQGWQNVILVTSALHMRRSEALFRKEHIDVIPVAADFEAYGVPQKSSFSPFPRVRRFYLLSLYVHEKIGWWVYRLKGWV